VSCYSFTDIKWEDKEELVGQELTDTFECGDVIQIVQYDQYESIPESKTTPSFWEEFAELSPRCCSSFKRTIRIPTSSVTRRWSCLTRRVR